MKSDLNKYGFILKQEGTARKDRYPDALNPANIAIDDRTLEDFIVFANNYAKNILYVPVRGEIDPEQSWEPFFKDNSIFLMANIAIRDVNDVKETYNLLASHFQNESSNQNLIQIADYVFSCFKKIDEWYASFSTNNSLSNEIYLYIKSYLGDELKKLNQIFNYLRNAEKGEERYGNLINKDDVWELSKKGTAFSADDLFSGKTETEKLVNASYSLDKIFDTIFYVTANVINKCRNNISSSTYTEQDNPPHLSLFIAFIKLYGYVQDELNRMPQRLLEYYYKEVLGIKPRAAIPDKAFVIFELAKGFDSLLLNRGTSLTAGKDKKNIALSYTTDKDIVVSKAQVNAIKTIYIEKNKSGILNYYAATLKNEGVNSAIPAGGWSLFGVHDNSSVAVVGFSIASTQFYLAKGEREVSISFELLDEIPFEEFDTTLVALRLTGEKGWITTQLAQDNAVIKYFKKTDEKKLELNFSIAIAQQSAVVAFDPKIHTGNYKTDNPLLEIQLQFPQVPSVPNKDVYDKYLTKIKQLTALQSITILNTGIKVLVGSIGQKASFNGLRDLILQNHESVLNGKKPFLPFTSVPQVGSSLYIGCDDLFYKPIQTLTLNFEWMLPDNFRSYYDKYFPPYDANKYLASLSVLKNQHWVKLGDVSIIDAYADDPKFTTLVIDLQKEPSPELAGEQESSVSKFDVTKQDGTLKLKLNYPDFGHEIYPQLLTATVMEKATSKTPPIDFYKVVKKQLHNSVISIKYPDVSRKGPLKEIIYDILDSNNVKDDEAKILMINNLDAQLKDFNGSAMSVSEIKSTVNINFEAANTTIVNQGNFFQRIVRALKDRKFIDEVLEDEKRDVEDVAEEIDSQIDKNADFILPDDREMVELILEETNSIISQVVVKIVGRLFVLKNPDDKSVGDIFEHEVKTVNKVINDLIARKISSLLSAREIPPKPYTPLINALSISYSSTKKLSPGDDQFFQILPFGIKEIPLCNEVTDELKTTGDTKNIPVFPQFLIAGGNNDNKTSGLLFVGIKDALPNQNLSVLFQFAEGSRTSDKKPPKLELWYLKNNEWIALKDEYLVSDGTTGLQATGIVEISLPPIESNNTTIFDGHDLFWLGISVDEDIDAFPKLVDIASQAVTVTFVNDNNDPAHLSFPLPAKKIVNLTEKLAGIKSVRQPVASQNGKVAEHEPGFYTRVSERLRHKGRAINNWDYERLVLEAFPSIYKIKCINNYNSGAFSAGHVTLVPIADLSVKSAGDPIHLMPRVSYMELQEIEEFVKSKSSPFVKVHAINPQLDYVKISCKVKFYKGEDKGYCLKRLNEEIISFLTPWAAADKEAITFSAKMYVSTIITFIDKRPYVDYVSDLTMMQYYLNSVGGEMYSKGPDRSTSLVETQFTTGHSILVSAPAHDIQLL